MNASHVYYILMQRKVILKIVIDISDLQLQSSKTVHLNIINLTFYYHWIYLSAKITFVYNFTAFKFLSRSFTVLVGTSGTGIRDGI